MAVRMHLINTVSQSFKSARSMFIISDNIARFVLGIPQKTSHQLYFYRLWLNSNDLEWTYLIINI